MNLSYSMKNWTNLKNDYFFSLIECIIHLIGALVFFGPFNPYEPELREIVPGYYIRFAKVLG
ncbi:MAG: hypothetical protein LBI20_00105 [Holosporales bacterium]|nr:hypothetical protein [Holosporales bacterium]